MTLHLLDIIIDDESTVLNQECQQLQQQLNEIDAELLEVAAREKELESVPANVWKKVEKAKAKDLKKSKVKQLSMAGEQESGNTVDLTQAPGNTTEQVAVSTASMPGSNDSASSPIGAVVMIGIALLLCATSAVFYRKKQA